MPSNWSTGPAATPGKKPSVPFLARGKCPSALAAGFAAQEDDSAASAARLCRAGRSGMNKRGWLGCLSVCLLLAATVVVCVPALYWGLLGLLWGEHFYRGRPATYWDVQLSSSLTQLDAADDLRSGGAEAVPVLLDLLRDRKSIQRSTAADILGRMGSPARAAVAALRSIRDDPQDDKHLRRAAWLALRKITRSEAEPAPSEP
jgi:hypothetical protein